MKNWWNSEIKQENIIYYNHKNIYRAVKIKNKHYWRKKTKIKNSKSSVSPHMIYQYINDFFTFKICKSFLPNL